jgi:hypothetical protein
VLGNVNYSLIPIHMNMHCHLQVRRPNYVFIDILFSNFLLYFARAAWSLVDPGTGLVEQRINGAGPPHLINYLKIADKNWQ